MSDQTIRAREPWIAEWLMTPLRASRLDYAKIALAAAFINIFALATSLFSMTVYDRIVPNNALDSLVVLAIGIGIVLVFDFVLKFLRGYFIDIAGHRIDRQVGSAIFQQMLGMRLANRKGSTGAFAGVLREFEALRDFFASATLAAVVDVPFILLFLVVIWLIGGPLVLVPLILVPVVVGTALAVQPALERITAQVMNEGLTKQGVLVESVAGLETIKSSDAGGLLGKRWERAVEAHARISIRQRLLAGIAINTANFAQQLSYIGIVVFGVNMIAQGELTMGGMIACSILGGRAVSPLSQIATLLTRITHTRTAYRQINELMQSGGEVRRGTTYLRRERLAGAIAFRDVVFRYPGSNQRSLDQVSFSVAPGERVGVLGRVGSGKSTITRLILGLFEPDEGTVLIDNTDVRQLHPEDLRRNVGSILQDIYLLSGSVRDNIALGREGVSDEEVLRTSEIAGVHDFIGRIPNGYDLRLADRGEGLSGGQRQAIALARALVGQRQILLFDEPTSAMDTQSENALIGRMEKEIVGRTLVLVTHRASMLRLVERVIILEAGRIIADGPRDEVLKTVMGAQTRRPQPQPQQQAAG